MCGRARTRAEADERVLLSCVGACLIAAGVILEVLAPGRTLQPPASLPCDGEHRPQHPNILILLADDVGVDNVGAYAAGLDLPSTPNIDSLAASGILFRNAWSNPICSTTRATIQTGRYGYRTGVGSLTQAWSPYSYGLPLAELTLPEMLDLGTTAGYAHAAVGKWHMGSLAVGGADSPNLAGYSHFSGPLDNIGDYFAYDKTVNGQTAASTTYATTEQVDDAIQWISSASEPWLCHLAFSAAHTPLHAPPPDLHTVDLSGVDPDPHQEPRPYFKAMVEALDTEIGRLLDHLPANTLVIFAADNGTPGFVAVPPNPYGKGSLREEGIHVPMIVSGPAVLAPGTECEALVDTTDVFATVAELAGVDLGAPPFDGLQLDSVSLVPYLADPLRPSIREHVLAENFSPSGLEDHSHLLRCLTLGAGFVEAVAQRLCHEDIGHAGPGALELTICGGATRLGEPARLEITGAPPGAAGAYFSSYNPALVPMFGGMLIGPPWRDFVPLQTDLQGRFHCEILGTGEERVFCQATVEDPAQIGGYAISNVVEVLGAVVNTKAIRNQRYKLIADQNRCLVELFDLQDDPGEESNLFEAPMSPEAWSNFQELRSCLNQRFGS